ncbi:DUF3613 domain-containing protein [Bordetella genomosp. 7]|uniref:TapA domain-containing protein n=1 Tax=Bordetella genomosp. 7 TaxID=1416805 RepID=A0A261QYE9_9BORD|nr:DUF3613 domain-containing protein [Bordetella genomosp. 7]OZI17818.1 TapA domain-containing protein [Bordetella genomosp. 7]
MSRYVYQLPIVLAALLPGVAGAQMNAPLTGGAAAQPAASATPVAPASPQAMPARPVVRQVQTPMPAAAPTAAASTAAASTAAASTAAASTAPASAQRDEAVGDVTRALMAAQADGRRAGGALPILGPVSSASWQRYLDSFRQPIPQWFGEKVETDSN